MRSKVGFLALSALLFLVAQVIAQGPKPFPAVVIEKATNGVDADDPAAGDAPVLAVGDAITWTYKVVNVGTADLSNIIVTDDQGVAVTCPRTILAPGEMMDCTGLGTALDLMVAPANLVPGFCDNAPTNKIYRNVGQVTALSPTGTVVTDNDPSHYCNPADDIPPPPPGVCVPHDRGITLTHNATRSLNVENFFSLDPVSCPVGYVIAWAAGDEQVPIEWNHLTGSTYIRSPGGAGLNRTKGAQAIGVLGDPQDQVAEGTPLNGAAGGAFPNIPFDGVAYAELATTLRTDFVADTGNRFSRLTLLTPDINAPLLNPPTQMALDWWNEAEDRFSSSAEYHCMVRQKLGDISGGFSLGALGSFHGNLRAVPFGNEGVIGVIEEVEPNRGTLRNLFHNDPAPGPVISTGGRQPGSAVIFPLFDLSENHRTVLRVTNNHPTDDVDVHLVAICGEDR